MGKGKKMANKRHPFNKQRAQRGRSHHRPNYDLQHFDDIPIEDFIKPDQDQLLLKPPSLAHLDLGDEDQVDLTNEHFTSPPVALLQQDDSFYFDTEPSNVIFSDNTSSITIDLDTSPDLLDLSTGSKKTAKKQRAKVQKARKIIPGDDIYISSDDGDYLASLDEYDDHDEALLEAFSKNNGMTHTYHDEAAIDQDFIENTDPETWQQLQQWATQQSVDDPVYESINLTDDEDDDLIDQTVETTSSDNAMFDFGLCDSDEDEYIQNDKRQDEAEQRAAWDMNNTIRNTLVDLPPSLHAGMHGYMKHNRVKKKSRVKQNRHETDNNPLSKQLARIDRRIQLFMNDQSRRSYQFPAMSMFCRNQVRDLATLYGIRVSFEDLGCKKIGPLLSKNPHAVCSKRRIIDKHIDQAWTQWTRKQIKVWAQRQKRTKAMHEQTRATRKRPTATTRSKGKREMDHGTTMEHGAVVGSLAAPLASNNLGHKMLAKMGWKVGDSLGASNEGIVDPIQAVMHTKRRGLGA